MAEINKEINNEINDKMSEIENEKHDLIDDTVDIKITDDYDKEPDFDDLEEPPVEELEEISQEELANLLGISRQTYSAIERKLRRMSWSTYLSLILFFDHNQKSHKMLRALSLFPKELVIRFNDGIDYSSFELSKLLGTQAQDIVDHLDDQAKQTIRSIVMMEYARCTQLPSDAIIKSFGGMNYATVTARDYDAAQALKAIKQSNAHE